MDQVVSVGRLTARPNRHSFFETNSMWLRSSSRIGPWTYPFHRLFITKVADAYEVIQQQYADDTQLCIAMSKMSSTNAIIQLPNCVTALHQWFAENGLALNPDKSKAVLFSMPQRAKGLSVNSTIDAARSTVVLSSKIKLLGVTLDGNLNFNDQVKNVCRVSLFHFRTLRQIRHSVWRDG